MSRRSRSVLTALLASLLLVTGSMSTALARSPNAHPKDTPPAPTATPTPTSGGALVVAPSAHVPPGQAKKQTAEPAAPESTPTPTAASPKGNNGQGNGQGNGPEKQADPSVAADAAPDGPSGADPAAGAPSASGPTQQLACGNGKPATAPAPTPTPTLGGEPGGEPTPTPTPEPAATPEPTPTGEPTPIVIPGAQASAATSAGSSGGLLGTLADSFYGKVAGTLLQRFNDKAIRDFCNLNALRNTLRAEISNRLKRLAAMEKLVAGAGLSTEDLAVVDAGLFAVGTDLRSLQGRVETDTTLAALEADRSALMSMDTLLATTARWVNDIRAAEAAVAEASSLRDRELTLLALMTSLPPDRAAVVAPLLGQLGELLDAGRAAARSALTSLLDVSAADLESGAAATALTGAEATLTTADAALRQAAALADRAGPLVDL